jgi:tetratricopeptide (TPR) repeat protein
VIERAAVEGRTFHRSAVAELLPTTARHDVGARLLALVRKQLIRPDRSNFAGDDGFRFAHMLIRDAAYESSPKELRAELHERYADWLEEKVADRVHEHEEILGYHLEQAALYRRELFPLDDEAVELGRRAAGWLGSAGLRAPGRGDQAAAVALLSRAVSMLPDDDAERIQLLPELGEALGDCGDYASAIAVLREAVERAEAIGDRRTRSYGVLLLGAARRNTDPEFTAEEALDEAEEVLGMFEELADELGQARAWDLVGWHHHSHGRCGAALKAHEQALEHATAAADEHWVTQARLHIGTGLFFGETPVEEAISYAEALIGEDAMLRGRSLQGHLGVGHAMRGNFETGRELISEQAALHDSRGSTFLARFARARLGMVEMLAGDFSSAEVHLREGYEALDEAGETGFLSTMATRLGEAVCAQGRFEEAERYTRIGEEASAPDDYVSQILWRSVRAKAIAGQGGLEDAGQLAREAVALARETDDIDLQGDAAMALAEVLRLAARPDEAVPFAEEALRLYERKGNLVSAAKASSLLGEQ